MPLYEYRCLSCGEHIEVLQHVSDASLTTCARCEGVLEKVISAPALQFKGSGWYITDYARSGKAGTAASRGAEPAESKGAEPAESKGEKKAEAKPADAKAAKPGSDTKSASA